jgi:alcohol dehydrogenase
MADIRVATLVAFGEPLKLDSIEKPVPGPTDVLVKVAACGIVPNASNIVKGLTKHLIPEPPTVLGLDVTGTIEAVGEHVVGLEVGQRVYLDPHLTCGTCKSCRAGRIDLCWWGTLRGYFSNTPLGQPLLRRYPIGGFSEYVVSPDRNVAVLPDSIDFVAAARLGYMCTSFAGLRRARVTAGRTVLINGATGTLGVAATVLALAMGATKVLGIGRNKETLERVRQMDPRRVEVVSSDDVDDLPGWVRQQTKGLGVDAMYDCLGAGASSASTSALIGAVASGGRAILVGGSVEGEITQSYIQAYGDVSVAGSMWFLPGDLDDLIALIDSGVVDLSYLENHEYPLEQVNEALDFVGARQGGFNNTVVVPS